jgi:hypothetical protein
MNHGSCRHAALLAVVAVLAAPAAAPAAEAPRAIASPAGARSAPSTAKGRQVAARSRDVHDTAASWRAHHALFFQRNWGVDIVGVRRVASGMMLRFDYRVVDPDRASALTDKKARPYLVDERTRTALAVPAMENIGELRQVAPLEAGRTYYVLFGNPGGLVRKGGRVSLTVGNFKADGLVVE